MSDDMLEHVAQAIRLRDTTDEYAMARAAKQAIEDAGYVIMPRDPTQNETMLQRLDKVLHDNMTKLPLGSKEVLVALLQAMWTPTADMVAAGLAARETELWPLREPPSIVVMWQRMIGCALQR